MLVFLVVKVVLNAFLFCITVIHSRHRPGGRHESDRYESASMMSSDIETTSYQDSSDDQSR